MYSVQNSEADGEGSIHIAGSSLYELVRFEKAIMTSALSLKPSDVENEFNQMVISAVDNYNTFMAEVWATPGPLEIELLSNFSDFFNLVIDIKKRESATPATAAAAATPATAAAALAEEEQPAKKIQRKK